MGSHWSFSDSKSSQVSGTLLSILDVLLNGVLWKVSTRPQTSQSFSPFINPLFTVPKTPITIGIIVTSMLHISFQFPSKVEVLILLFTFFQFYFVVSQSTICHFSFSGLLAKIRWSVWMSKSHRNLYISFSRTAARLCVYHLFLWSNSNFLHMSQRITLTTRLCFTLRSAGTAKSTFRQVTPPFFLTITRSGRLAKIRRSVFISKSQRILCVIF